MTQKSIEDLRLRVRWVRGKHRGKIDFSRPMTKLVLGGRGSGKSSLLENMSCRYDKTIDVFGSRDNEGLSWLRAEGISANEILLMTGNSVEISGQWDALKMREISLSELKRYRVATSVSAFYGTLDEEFDCLNALVYKILYRRGAWSQQWDILVREASNFLYSRVKITRNQTIAKNDFLYLMREGRHSGFPCEVDTIRWTSMDKEIRDTADYIFIKSVGILGLPRDLRFLYRYVRPYSLMDPHPSVFLVVTKKGAIGLGNFDYPPFHKEENEDLVSELGLKIEYGEVPRTGTEDARNVLGDLEHHEIIDKRLKGILGNGEHRGYRKIAKDVGRGLHTVHSHIQTFHNEDVRRLGYCQRCRRIKSPHETTIVD